MNTQNAKTAAPESTERYSRGKLYNVIALKKWQSAYVS